MKYMTSSSECTSKTGITCRTPLALGEVSEVCAVTKSTGRASTGWVVWPGRTWWTHKPEKTHTEMFWPEKRYKNVQILLNSFQPARMSQSSQPDQIIKSSTCPKHKKKKKNIPDWPDKSEKQFLFFYSRVRKTLTLAYNPHQETSAQLVCMICPGSKACSLQEHPAPPEG